MKIEGGETCKNGSTFTIEKVVSNNSTLTNIKKMPSGLLLFEAVHEKQSLAFLHTKTFGQLEVSVEPHLPHHKPPISPQIPKPSDATNFSRKTVISLLRTQLRMSFY